jgi:hypothetical protein
MSSLLHLHQLRHPRQPLDYATRSCLRDAHDASVHRKLMRRVDALLIISFIGLLVWAAVELGQRLA